MKKQLFILIIVFCVPFLNGILYSQNNKHFVSLINAFFDEREAQVVISWEPVSDPRAVYRVYRFDNPVKTEKIIPLKTNLIEVLDYNVSRTRDIPPSTGTYYYYVSVIIDDDENTSVLPDQNYTLQPIKFFRPSGMVRDLKGKFLLQNTQILLQWEKPKEGEELKSYFLYRSNEIIQNISKAEKIAELKAGNTMYFDKIPQQGNYYYAVTTVSDYDYENRNLMAGQNTLNKPIRVMTLDARKLPDFYLNFPMDLSFTMDFSVEWSDLPEKLRMFPLDINPHYQDGGLQQEPQEKKPGQQAAVSPQKEQKMAAEDQTKEKDELKKIHDLFENYYRKRNWEGFLDKTQVLKDQLTSEYARKKLMLFRAISLFNSGRREKAALIIGQLKTDKKFLRYNQRQIRILEQQLDRNGE
jgi:hypothetical protein